jgi:hypothetical protein
VISQQNRLDDGIPSKEALFTQAAAILRLRLDPDASNDQKEKIPSKLAELFNGREGGEILACVRQIFSDGSLMDPSYCLERNTAAAVCATLGHRIESAGSGVEQYRYAKAIRADAFRLLSEHASRSFRQVERWIKVLDIDVSKSDARRILTGMQRCAAPPSDIWEVTERYGVEIDNNYAKQYVLGQLLGDVRWHHMPDILQMIEVHALEFSEDEKFAVLNNLVKQNQFYSAKELTPILGELPKMVEETRQDSLAADIQASILSGDIDKFNQTLSAHNKRYDPEAYEKFRSAALATGPDYRTALVKLMVERDGDTKYLEIWPELKSDLLQARLAICFDETLPFSRRFPGICRLLRLVGAHHELRPLISGPIALELREIAMQELDCLSGIARSGSSPALFKSQLGLDYTSTDWERWVEPFVDRDPFAAASYLKRFGVIGEISEPMKTRLFESAKVLAEKADDTSLNNDIVDLAVSLNQPVDDELVILNLKKLEHPSVIVDAIKKHGLPDSFEVSERRQLYDRIEAKVDYASVHTIKHLEKCAKLLDHEFTEENVARVLRQRIYEPNGNTLRKKLTCMDLECLADIYKEYRVMGEEILDAHFALTVNARRVESFALESNQIDKFIEGLIRDRDNSAWYGKNCLENSVLIYSAKYGKLGDVFSALIGDGDLPWLLQTIRAVHYNQEIRKAFIESVTPQHISRLVMLQSALVAKGHYHDAIRLKEKFRLPEVPELTRWRSEQN